MEELSNTEYAPLHTHTSFSALDGLPKVHEIVDRVKELGQKGFAVTDHGVMSGIPQFYKAAQEAGLVFAPGIEMYFTSDRKKHAPDFYGQKYYHLILLAHSNEGYANLSRLQRRTWTEGYYYKPRADFELLKEYSEGLTVTTACLGSMFNQALLRGDMKFARSHLSTLIDIFGRENVYIEVQNHGSDADATVIPGQLQLAEEMDVELLATNDSHYCSPDDYESHDLLLCTSTGSKRDDEKRFHFENDQFYMKSTKEMLELFPEDKFPRAVSNSQAFIDKVDFSLPMGDEMEYLMPHVPDEMLAGKTEAETLRELVSEGLRDPSRYGDEEGNIPEEAAELAKYELGVIENMGFPGYFLIVKRILDLFRENGIAIGAGRGSAPGSIVSYSLGITNIDPIEHKLLFWRFLSPDRISMPDIDSDIPKSQRQKALSLLKDEFGADRIAQLTTYSEMKDKDALQRAAKSIGYAPGLSDIFKKTASEAMEIADMDLPEFANEVIKYTFDNYNIVKDSKGYDTVEVPIRGSDRVGKEKPAERRIRIFIESVAQKFPDYHTILKTAAAFVNTISSYGVHACGLVITPMPIDDLVPVRAPKKDSGVLPVTQYDGHAVEAMGAVKIDLLGIQTLDYCIDTERNILEDLGEEVDSSNLEPDDEKVYNVLSRGEGKGVFQMSCLTGDTVVDGRRMDTLYEMFNDRQGPDKISSVRFNNGLIADNKVKAVVKTGVKPVYELVTDKGRIIKATAGHRFFTQDGWKELKDILVGSDSVLTIPQDKLMESYPHRFLTDRERIMLIEKMTDKQWKYPYGGEVSINGVDYKLTAVSPEGDAGVITYAGSDNMVSKYRDKFENIIVISDAELVEQYGDDSGVSCALPICSRKERVMSVTGIGEKETYDIAMHGPFHNYIANDFVVHNSGGMRRLMMDMKPDKFDDIIALGALYRPGPLGMGVHHQYADRKNGREDITVIHPDAMEILEDSYGLCLTGDTEVAVTSGDGVGFQRVKLGELNMFESPYILGVDGAGNRAEVKVTKWWSLGEKDTWQLVLANGTKLRGSFDHPVLTGRGWVTLNNITKEDVIATMGSEPSNRAFAGVPLSMLDTEKYEKFNIAGVVPMEDVDPEDISDDVNGGYSSWISWESVLMSAPTGMKEEVFDISVPETENFLAESIVTHNCIYQEHIMSIARKFADFTGGEADELRKAMGKKIPEMMEQQHDKFVTAVNENYPGEHEYLDEHGNSKKGKLGDAWWNYIEPHASYSFNKCLLYSTRIRMADGVTTERITDLHKRFVAGEELEVMSMWPDGEVRPHKVKNVVATGSKGIVKLKTQSGKVLNATPEHRLLTTRGYLPISDILVGEDELIVGEDIVRPITDKQREARSNNMKKLNATPERKERDKEAAERFKKYQATLTFEDRSRHQKNINATTDRGARQAKIMQKAWREKWDNDPVFRDKLLTALEDNSNNKKGAHSGFGRRSQASNGADCHSDNELAMAEFLIDNDIEFEMHKRVGKGWCDFYFNGMYWEMDGMDRHYSYFEKKYGDIPFTVVTPEDFKEIISDKLGLEYVRNGDLVVSIEEVPNRDGARGWTTYDIEMEPGGPKNFLISNGIVSHNSHSVAYAVLSYRTAWLKTHYPAQFGAACIDIDSQGSDKNKTSIGEHIDWLSRFGVTVKSPDINKSIMRGVTTNESITLPMHIVRGIGDKRAISIIREREENGEFTSVVDAVERCKLNAGEIKNLSLGGAFESLGADRFQVVCKVDDILEEAKNLREHRELSEGLFSFSVTEGDYEPADLDLERTPQYCDLGDNGEMEVSHMSLRKIENGVLGLSVQPHPFSKLEKGLEKSGKIKGLLSPADVAEQKDGTQAKIYGVLSSCLGKESKAGKRFTVFNISSLDTDVSAIRFDEMDVDEDDELPVIVTGKIVDDTFREGNKKVIVDKVSRVRFRKK